MKKLFALLMAGMLLFSAAAVATEEEVSFADVLQGFSGVPGAGTVEGTVPQDTPQVKTDGDAVPADTAPEGNVRLLPDEEGKEIIISAAGDLTIGGRRGKGMTHFDKELAKNGDDANFIMKNIKSVFEQDTMTLVNFEGTLTDVKEAPANKKGNDFLFAADPKHVHILREGSIEAVAFENNHAMDYGTQGNQDTRAAFDGAGVVYSSEDHMGVYEVGGISIAMLSYQTFGGRHEELARKVVGEIAEAKKRHDVVIVSYHWGNELDYAPNKNQIFLGRATIDAGADLVLGHHSHRINPIELYKGRYIVYSLANFSFAGNRKPNDMSTFIFQVKMHIKNGETTSAGFRILPGRISSRNDYNDLIPTLFEQQAQQQHVINVLKKNGKKLEYAVPEYPTEWE